MRRFVGGLATVLLAAGSPAAAARAGDGPPPLTPPVLGPSVEIPPAELPPPHEAAPIDGPPQPILVVPGVTTPRPGSGAHPAPSHGAVHTPTPTSPEAPPLLGPAGMPRAASGRVGTAGGARAPGSPPTTLESVPADDELGEHRVRKPGQSGRTTVEGGSVDHPRPSPNVTRPGLFGRLLGPPQTARTPTPGHENVRVEARSDPAADAALKRRIERQIAQTLGNRVRSYEVRVVGRNVTIRAVPVRFWQRRAVRTTLESLPTLSGYKATVLIDG